MQELDERPHGLLGSLLSIEGRSFMLASHRSRLRKPEVALRLFQPVRRAVHIHLRSESSTTQADAKNSNPRNAGALRACSLPLPKELSTFP